MISDDTLTAGANDVKESARPLKISSKRAEAAQTDKEPSQQLNGPPKKKRSPKKPSKRAEGEQEGEFVRRHIGSNERDLSEMLASLKVSSLDELIKETVPKEILERQDRNFLQNFPAPLSESETLKAAQVIGEENRVFKSYIGQGFHPSFTPPVILRNVLENPVWLTPYTPYQPELAQGRLEALLNFQTLISDLTALPIANSSLLDEGTAAAEALTLAKNVAEEEGNEGRKVFMDSFRIFPHIEAVVKTRAKHFGWTIERAPGGGVFGERFSGAPNLDGPHRGGKRRSDDKHKGGLNEDIRADKGFFAALIQYPAANGEVYDLKPFLQKMSEKGVKTVVVCDPLALCLLKPADADVAVGSSQRFGIPLFFGGPHAAFFATKKEYSRWIPGRLVGVSRDRNGKPALRLALQTREQHIRRERAASNICTAQALLAVAAGFFAVYHGPEGLRRIALQVHNKTRRLFSLLKNFHPEGQVLNKNFFDTLQWKAASEDTAEAVYQAFLKHKINIGRPAPDCLSWSLNETTTEADVQEIVSVMKSALAKNSFSAKRSTEGEAADRIAKDREEAPSGLPASCLRKSKFLEHAVFNSYQSETKLLRYMHHLQEKELSLAHSMIPLGSCTMKLNGAASLRPLTQPAFADIHPFAPEKQWTGFRRLIDQLEKQLCALTGFSAFSFQPNAGSQGEYAGLIAVKNYHASRGEGGRDICLIPVSAHGTNPASARMAGLKPVSLASLPDGSIDCKDLDAKLKQFKNRLAAAMITYPSAYGFFEKGMPGICRKIHQAGGLVYWDGANMNALLGICAPRSIGFDVGHLNLHKTFCIPHGGGGPGAGPVGVIEELIPFLPRENFRSAFPAEEGARPRSDGEKEKVLRTGDIISSAPFGNAGVLIVSWAYIVLMGRSGLKKSAEFAIAHANYMAERLKPFYRILFTGEKGRTAHEAVLDFRKFKRLADITVEDVAKRLMDYGFHAPTMSWPVPGIFLAEPTESESKEEIDRFCDALIAIRKEIERAETDKSQKALLKNAPHVLEDLMKKDWPFPYSREEAFYPLPWLRKRKFQPPVSRVENAYGDINLFCSCPQ